GRLGQVPTGEGKTMIVAILAAILALRNQTVDIITASEELAKPAAEEMKEFFGLFGFSAPAIGENTSWGSRIVYGDAAQFQFADLRYRFAEEHQEGGGRGAEMRPYQVAIIDESDSLMVDGKGSQALIGSSAPGAHYLQNFITVAWGIMLNAKKNLHICKQGHILCFLQCGHFSPPYADADDPGKPDAKPVPRIHHMRHHRDYIIRAGIVQWALASVDAMYRLEPEEHYRLKNGPGEIKLELIDSTNTGCISDTSQYTGGLAQFLQLKHGLTITSNGFTTNYVSNAGFFKKYEKIFGLTGTLGDAETSDFLGDTYKLDFFFVPGFKSKQFHMLRGIFHTTEKAWTEAVLQQTLVQAKLGRAVLVICKSLKVAKKFHNQFTKKIDEPNPQDKRKLEPGTIIVATNIAGRGTDINLTDEVEKNGGLHVIITFRPLNDRVQQQNVGRTSRTGNRGTAQLIL
ncbi:unnamed protein product, partial [Amoebophrya sp. A120]